MSSLLHSKVAFSPVRRLIRIKSISSFWYFLLPLTSIDAHPAALKHFAAKASAMNAKELESEKFNIFRNYIASQYSFMHIHQAMSEADPYLAVKAIAKKVVS